MVPADAPQASISPQTLLLGRANFVYNQLIEGTDLQLPSKAFRIRLDFPGGLASSVPANVYWSAMGQTLKQKLQEGQPEAYVWVPGLEQLQKVLEEGDPMSSEPKKNALAKLMDRLVTQMGGPPHPVLHSQSRPTGELDWLGLMESFREWFENNCLTAFERAKEHHSEGVQLALECQADMIVRMEVVERLVFRLSQASLRAQIHTPSPQLVKLTQSLRWLFLEWQVYQRFAHAAGWAKEVTPDSPIWTYLPAENRPGARPRQAVPVVVQQADVQEPPEAAVAQVEAEEAANVPVLHFDDVDAQEGFEPVAQTDELLNHPRFRFYMEDLRCQHVVRAAKWNSKTVAFLFVTKKGTRIAFVDSCHEGHAACYVFRCGLRTDNREVRTRWATQSQLPRKRVRQEGAAAADTLIGRPIRHGSKGGWKKTIRQILENE